MMVLRRIVWRRPWRFTAGAHRWGDGIHFTVAVATGLDGTAREVLRQGDIGY